MQHDVMKFENARTKNGLLMIEFEPFTSIQQSAKLRGQCADWKRKLRRAYRDFEFRGNERGELEYLLGIKGATERLLASNITLRAAASEILAQLFGELQVASLSIPRRRFLYGSFLGPLVNERQPVLDIDAFRHRVYKLIASEGLSGVFGIELQILTNYPGRGRGASFMMNAHALLWTEDAGFDHRQAQVRMRKSGSLHSELGAATVSLTPRRLDEGQLEYAGRYMLAPPVYGQFRARHDEIPSRWVLKPTTQVRAALMLRLAEILSHLELTDLIWSVNEDTRIRTRWKQQLVGRNEISCARHQYSLKKDLNVSELWSLIRAPSDNGCRLYKAPFFNGKLPKCE